MGAEGDRARESIGSTGDCACGICAWCIRGGVPSPAIESIECEADGVAEPPTAGGGEGKAEVGVVGVDTAD